MAGFVQQGTSLYGVTPPQSLTITGVTAGHALIVPVGRTSSAGRDYVVSSDLDGSFGSPVATSVPARTGFPQYVFVLHNVSAGNHTISISQVSGTAQPMHATVIEADGLDALATPITSAFWDGTDDGAHHSAAVGEIDTTVASFMVACAVLSGTNGGAAAGSGFNALTSGNVQAFYQWRDSTSAESDQRGEFTNSGTARSATTCIVAFPYAASAATLTGGTSATASWTTAAGTLTAHAHLTGTTATASWTSAAGVLTAQARLTSTTATASWAIAAGTLTAHALLSGLTATSVWAIAGGTLDAGGVATLVGGSAIASWLGDVGTATLVASLSGVSATALWTVPHTTLTLTAALSGISSQSVWALETSALTTSAVLSGTTATATWQIVPGTLTHSITLAGGPSAGSVWHVASGPLVTLSYDLIMVVGVGAGVARLDGVTAGTARVTVRTHHP